MSRHNGVPTEFAGTRFRSRLEARWAHFFTGIGWEWEYEPFDMDGYIPDFLILGARPFLVEVKPAATIRELEPVASKMPLSDGDNHIALAVGARWRLPGEWDHTWPTAGLISQWFHDGEPDGGGQHYFAAALWSRCLKCDKIGVYHETGGFVLHPCGDYEGDHYLGAINEWELDPIWAAARNETQWMARL